MLGDFFRDLAVVSLAEFSYTILFAFLTLK